MKDISIVVCLWVALLPSHILGDDSLKIELDKMAEDGGTINGIFKPSENGYFATGLSGITYRGTLLLSPNSIEEVLMKFSGTEYSEQAVAEYENYTFLNAINRTEVETYGVPSVKYYGSWEEYILLAIPSLDSSFDQRIKNHSDQPLREMDFLIICREFVRIMKYIHGIGLYHHEIRRGNIMFRKNRVFITEYGVGDPYRADNTYKITIDWKDFIKEILKVKKECGIRSAALSRVLKEFTKSISRDQEIPNYGTLYDKVNQEIIQIHGDANVHFSWLTFEDRMAADDLSIQNPIAAIGSIRAPPNTNYLFPTVNEKFFDGYNQGGAIEDEPSSPPPHWG